MGRARQRQPTIRRPKPQKGRPKAKADSPDEDWDLLRSNPIRYLEIANKAIMASPDDPKAYFRRHFAWEEIGAMELALDDLDKVATMWPNRPAVYGVRGCLLRKMQRFESAIADLDKLESMEPDRRLAGLFSLVRADCHAHLGNLEAALADCANLDEDHWTPGFGGAPAGDRAQATAAIERKAREVRKRKVAGG